MKGLDGREVMVFLFMETWNSLMLRALIGKVPILMHLQLQLQ
jgi:hypothetical protein